jgi:hypothetical protein
LGAYEFVFYTIFNTPHAGDSMVIQIKYSNLIEESFSINNPTNEIFWNKKTLQFFPKTKSFEVKFEFSRNTSAGKGLIAFDNVTLYQISAGGMKS